MMGLVFLTFGIVGQWLFGVLLAMAIFCRPGRAPRPFAELAGFGCVLGIAGTAWCLFVWSFCGGPLGTTPSVLITVIGYGVGGPFAWRQFRSRDREPTAPGVISLVTRQQRAVACVCQALIAGLFAACVLQTLQTPQKLWDERSIFAIKGRVLFEDRSINSSTLLHPDFVQYHPRYPLLLPLAEEHIYALLGHVDDRLSKLVFSALYLGMVLAVAGVLSRHWSCDRAWMTAAMVATVPALMPYEYGFLCGQADAPVACFHTVSVLYLWDALVSQRRGVFRTDALLAAGLSAGATVFTKDEGIAFFIIDTGILALFGVLNLLRGIRIRDSLIAMTLFPVTAGVMLLPWFLHRRSLPLTTEMNYFGRMTLAMFVGRVPTLGWSGPHLIRRMFWEWREWGLQWWLMAAAWIAFPWRALQQSQLLFILDVVGALASLLVAGMLAPAQLDEHIGGSSHRFLMQIAPAAVLFAMTQWFSERELTSPADSGSGGN
ncbi:hypothetical protein [Schlesneria paludicola]|uniref:hypothetical protein n=1 Tax=Schlesneria paludicola TaxID=360056 RepID=UPI00029A632D|nr:hypothetical protein [Schlesneria paludicola]